MVITILGEFPAFLGSLVVMDNPNIGRRRTIYIFYFFSFLMNIASYLDWHLAVWLFLSRLVYRELSAMLYTYTTEIYPTPLRALGIGWGICSGKVASCLMSFFLFPLLEINVFYPFLLFAAISLISTICGFLLKQDTTGQHLDQEEILKETLEMSFIEPLVNSTGPLDKEHR